MAARGARAAGRLLAIGGVLYSLGTLFHVWQHLRFQNAIWHGSKPLQAGAAQLPGNPASRGQPMSTEDDPEKSREESPEWHRERANRLRKNGFTKMAQEHEQIAQTIERRRQQQAK